MKYQYGFGDEAGSASNKTGSGSSVYFTTALLLTNDPEELREYVRQFRREKRIHGSSEMSFSSSPDANRVAFLRGLLAVNFVVRAVVIDKRTLRNEIRLKGLDFYVHFWTMLFKWLAFKELDRAHVILHEYGGPKTTIPALMRNLRSQAAIHVPGPHLRAPIRATRTRADPGIEAADMVASSIFRMAEEGDARFYRLIRPRTRIWRPIENENPPD